MKTQWSIKVHKLHMNILDIGGSRNIAKNQTEKNTTNDKTCLQARSRTNQLPSLGSYIALTFNPIRDVYLFYAAKWVHSSMKHKDLKKHFLS